MSQVHSNDTERVQKSGSCDSTDEFQSDLAYKEIEEPEREGKHVEQFTAAENESEDISPNGKRTSESSYGTENSVLSSHLSLQALQALNDASAQNDDQMRNTEEICLYEQGPLNEVTIEANPDEAFREFDLSCSSPLLNGHAAVDNEVHITTEKPQETNSQGSRDSRRSRRRIISSFFSRKPRTSPSNSKRSNGDVVVTIDADEVTVVDSRPKPKPSFNDRVKGWLQPMDNKMNIKVFGSRKAMADELLRYSKAGWIIHPTSAFRFVNQFLFPGYVVAVVVVFVFWRLFFIYIYTFCVYLDCSAVLSIVKYFFFINRNRKFFSVDHTVCFEIAHVELCKPKFTLVFRGRRNSVTS